MASPLETIKSRLPHLDLRHLSLVTPNPVRVQEWTSSLPKVNVGECSRQVYLTLQELNRLQTDVKNRIGILEALRPTVYFLCQALSRHYLGQPIILPEKAAKVATLAQAMQNHLAIGYKIACVELIESKQDPEQQKLLALALHRSITDLGASYLRCCQLYLNPPQHLWHELHNLFLLAQRAVSTQRTITDPIHTLVPSTGIDDAYLQVMLLATCRPYQLRQQDIVLTYNISELWTERVRMRVRTSEDRLYVFNPDSDCPPMYASQAKNIANGPLQALVLDDLVSRLQDLLLAHKGNITGKQGEEALSPELLRHLIHAWGDLSERSFKRSSQQGILNVCVGMSATHYFLAGARSFEDTLQQHSSERYIDRLQSLQTKADPWSGAYKDQNRPGDILGDIEFSGNKTQNQTPQHHLYSTQIVNTSPGGYGLAWLGETPVNVRNGEVIGLQPGIDEHISIGVIRWLRQLPGLKAEFGVEILSPRAEACAVKIVRKTGETSDFLRAIILPELNSIGKPMTVLVPNIVFKTGTQVILNLHGQEHRLELGRLVMSTANLCQFEFSGQGLTGQPANGDKQKKPGDDFDSIWSSL